MVRYAAAAVYAAAAAYVRSGGWGSAGLNQAG